MGKFPLKNYGTLDFDALKEFLEAKVDQYNKRDFINSDPIQIPHSFTAKEDIEISSLLTATIAWGNRKSIIKNSRRLMDLMDNAPYEFVISHKQTDLKAFEGFVHRTFNSQDAVQFIKSLKHIYIVYGGMESIFCKYAENNSLQYAIHKFKSYFFEIEHLKRSAKHISDPLKNSAAKRINMFLRWMVRSNESGVDFGIWKSISPAKLSCPLDVHSGNVARKIGLLKRKQNDAKAVKELDNALRKLDATDPVKYDFALFGLGVFENF
ncbi:MAG: TIGR02757 family protein [Bacteroidota bacterium]|nr:TIGR02757 family protein [Bacteroidota bacterium]